MTQKAIDEIREAREALSAVFNKYKEEERELQAELNTRLQSCDHRYPDGTTAINEYQNMCVICRKSIW